MLINPFDFKQLIAPIEPDVFFEEYWEKKNLLLTDRGTKGYEGLISLKDVDILLKTLPNPNTSWVKFINNKKEERLDIYLKGNSWETCMLNSHKVLNGFREGNTIVLKSLESRFEPIRKLAFGLEDIFGHKVKVNMYLTPHNAQGFQAHYDTHDVLILQIEGEKLWKIYDNYKQFPVGNIDVPFLGPLTSPTHEVFLKPGDLLYIPRGYVHEALTAKNYSLHLTVGIYATTWVDLLKELALEDPYFRQALPRGALCEDSNLELNIEKITKLCADKEAIANALGKLKTKFADDRTDSFYSGLKALSDTVVITTETQLKKKTLLTFNLVTEGENTFILYNDTALSMPSSTQPFLNYILNTPQFSIKTLPEHLDYLSENSKFVLVRFLMKSGIIELVNEP